MPLKLKLKPIGKTISVCGPVSPAVLLLKTCSSLAVVPNTVPPVISVYVPEELPKPYELVCESTEVEEIRSKSNISVFIKVKAKVNKYFRCKYSFCNFYLY